MAEVRPREYEEVSADTVPRRALRAALSALSFARVDLELPPDLRIVWFMPRVARSADLGPGFGGPVDPPNVFESEHALLGATAILDDNAIKVRATLGPLRTAEVVFHECHHAACRAGAGPPQGAWEYDYREQLAVAYQRGLAEIASVIARRELDHG